MLTCINIYFYSNKAVGGVFDYRIRRRTPCARRQAAEPSRAGSRPWRPRRIRGSHTLCYITAHHIILTIQCYYC